MTHRNNHHMWINGRCFVCGVPKPTGTVGAAKVKRKRAPAAEALSLIQQLAVAHDTPGKCRCAALHTLQNSKLATGHVHGCPVDEAVRLELAYAGIV